MAQSATEITESLTRSRVDTPFDGEITEVFTNTVNVRPAGSRTIYRDVKVPDHIWSETDGTALSDKVKVGYKVRLGESLGQRYLLAFFPWEEETTDYAGLGYIMPDPPTITNVVARKDGWHVAWQARSGQAVDCFHLYRNDAKSEETPDDLGITVKTSAVYPHNSGGMLRWFAGKAISGLNESELSPWVTDVTPPVLPAWASHIYRDSGHYVVWRHPDLNDVKEFVVYRNSSASDTGAIEVGRTSNLNYVIPYDPTTKNDWFGIQAIDYATNSTGIVWTAQAYDPTPATPAPIAQMARLGGYIVSWADVSVAGDVRLYEVQGATDSSGTNAATKWKALSLNTGILAETGVSWFRARAIGYGTYIGSWSAWVTDNNPPPQPILANSSGLKSVIVSLAASDTSHSSIGFSHYIFERADGSAGQGAIVLDSHALYSSFPRVISQTLGVTKYFRLTPYDWAGNVGTPSAWTAATPSTADATVQDKFDGYGGSTISSVASLYWLRLANFETTENWITDIIGGSTARDTTRYLEGAAALSLLHSYQPWMQSKWSSLSLSIGSDSRFSNDDYILLSYYNYADYPASTGDFSLSMTTSSGNYFHYNWTDSQPGVAGWRYLKIKGSDFTSTGTPTWNNITSISLDESVISGSGLGLTVAFDDLRLVKADPDNSSDYNDTGRSWDKVANTGTDVGEWHIYEGNRTGEPNKPYGYGQIKTATSPSVWYASYKPDLDIASGTIQTGIYHKTTGKSALAFFAKDLTADSWDMYAIEADDAANTVKLVKWVEGTRTEIASKSFAFNPGQTIWLGADFSGYDDPVDSGRIKVYASTVEGNLIQASNLKISVQDTSIGSGGTVGLLSYQTNVRFVNFVAGSPAHAEVADIAKALDGPIVAGEVRRVRYNQSTNRFEYSDDGTTWANVDSATAATANNADTVDGLHGTQFVRLDANNDMTAGKYIRFPHANQLNSNDGSIGAALFAEGLNIVGVQTVASAGRKIRLWGDLYDASGNKYLHLGSDGAGSGLNADLLDDHHAGNAASQIPLNNSTLNTNLNADLLDGLHGSSYQNNIEKIATVYLSADGWITFSSIPTSYRHLMLYGQARSKRTDGGNAGLAMRFNSDGGTNYYNSWLHYANGAIGGYNNTAVDRMSIGMIATDLDSWVYVSPVGIFIPRYADGYYKIASTSVASQTWSNGSPGTQVRGGGWKSTAVISTIQLFADWPTNTNLSAGSEVTLFGIRS